MGILSQRHRDVNGRAEVVSGAEPESADLAGAPPHPLAVSHSLPILALISHGYLTWPRIRKCGASAEAR